MTWDQITQTDKYRSLSPEVRQGVKERYFTRVIAPALSDKVSSQEELNDFYARFMERPDDTGEGALRSATSAFARGALRPLSDIPIAVGALTGAEGIEELGKGIQSGIEGAFPVNPAKEGFVTTELPELAGQVTSILGGGLGGASLGTRLAGKAATELAAKQAAKLGAKAAVGTQAFTGGAAGGAAAADQYGLTDGQKAARALLGGVTELGVEAIPLGKLTDGLLTETGAVRKLLGDSTIESGWFKPVTRGVKSEAAEEGLAETIGQATDVAFAPKQAQMDLAQIGKAMLLGGFGGAMFGGVQAVIAPQTTQAVNETGEFNRIRSTEELPQDVVEAVKRGDGSRLVYDRRGQVIGYKSATVSPEATTETVEAELPITINVPAEDETGPEWISGAGLLRAAERRAVQLENKAEDVDTSETDMEGNVIGIGAIKRGFLTPGEQNELNQLRKLLSGDEPDLAGLAALYGMKIKTQKTEGQTKQAPSATATPSQQPEQTRPSSEPATNPLSLVGKDARVMDNEGNIWQRVLGSPKWERVDASGRPLDKIGQEIDSPPVDVTREGITDPRYNRDLQTEAQDKNPEDAARPISLIKQILTELEMLADAQQDKGATRAERMQLLSDLLFWQNRLRQIAGKPQITEAPITQQEQEKSRAFLQARAAQIQAKLENNQPITSTERQEWLSAGMDEALLPPKEDDLKLSALPAEVAPEVEQMVQNVATNPTTPLTAAALAEDLQGGLTEAPQPDMEANLLTGVPMRQPLGGEIRAEETVLEGQPIEDEQAPQQLAKTDELTPTWETSPEFAAAEEAAAAGDLERADAIEAEWRVRNEAPEEISANLVDEEASVMQGEDVRIQAKTTNEKQAAQFPPVLRQVGREALQDTENEEALGGLPQEAPEVDLQSRRDADDSGRGVDTTYSQPLRYDSATDTYNGQKLRRGDIITNGEGAFYVVDRKMGFGLEVDRLNDDGSISAGGFIKLDPSSPEFRFNVYHTGKNRFDEPAKSQAPTLEQDQKIAALKFESEEWRKRVKFDESGNPIAFKGVFEEKLGSDAAYAKAVANARSARANFLNFKDRRDATKARSKARREAEEQLKSAMDTYEIAIRQLNEITVLRYQEAKLAADTASTGATEESPAGEVPTKLATEGAAPTPGGVGATVPLQRDPSKPEQMTPDEFSSSEKDKELPKNFVLSDGNGNYVTLEKDGSYKVWRLTGTHNTLAGTIGFKGDDGLERAKKRLAEVSQEEHAKLISDRTVYRQLPVSSEAVDAYGITLPQGYVRQGDLYVYQPDATPTPPPQPQPDATPAAQEAEPQAAALPAQPAEAEAAADAGVTSPETTAPTREQAASQRLRDYIATLPEKAQAAWTPERLAAADAYYASGDEAALEPLTKTQRSIVKREGTSDAEAKTADAERMRQFKQRNPQAATDIENLTEALNQLRDETTRISQAEPGDVSTGDTSETLDTEDVSSERAKAVQRYVAGLDWANMGAEQRRKAMLDFAEKISAKLANSPIWNGGLSVVVSVGENRVYTEFTVKGGSLPQRINLGLDTSIGEQSPSAEAALSQVYRVVEEEFMHAVHVQAAFNRWKQLKQDGDFKDWLIQDSAKNILEILGKRNALRSSGDNEAADRIQDSLAAIALMYWQGDEAIDVLDFLDDPSIATTFYLEAARMLAQVQIDGFSSETEFARFFHAIRQALSNALNLLRSAAELVKTGALGEALKRDVGTLQYAIRKMREYASMIDAAESGPPPASESEFLRDYNAYINSFGDEQLEQLRESREEVPEPADVSPAEVELNHEVQNANDLPDSATLEQVKKAAPVSVANAAAAAASSKSKAEWTQWLRENLSHLVRFAEKIWKQATATVAALASILSPTTSTKVNVAKEISPQQYSVAEQVSRPATFGKIAPWVELQKPPVAISQNSIDGYAPVNLPELSKQGGEGILNLSDIQASNVKFRRSPLEQARVAARSLDEETTMAVLPKRSAKYFLNQGSAAQVDALAEMLYEQESTSPKIAAMLKSMGISESPDTFPWCATSASFALTRAGIKATNTSSRAFLGFGTRTDQPQYGDLVVMWNNNPATGGRNGWGGHVGFYLGEVDGAIAVLSGNVNDEVNVSLYSTERVLGYRSVPQSPLTTARPSLQRTSLLRAKDGSVLRTGVETLEAEAARTSYEGIIPGVEQSWIGTSEEFRQQFPDGYNLGGGKKFPEPIHEALVAPDGRVFIFTDHAEILEGDVERALRYGTTPGVEATKRLLRHESFAHRGFMSLPAPLKRRFMDLIEAGVIPEAELDYLVKDRGYDNLADWRDNITQRQLIAEEWLAHKLERMKDIPQSGPLAEFLDWLKDVWRYLTGGETDSNAVLRDTMRAMHKALGALEPGQRIIDEQVRASLDSTAAMDAEYLAAVERGDSGNDNLIQLLRDAPQSERQAVINAWVQRNPAAAERAQRIMDEKAARAGAYSDNGAAVVFVRGGLEKNVVVYPDTSFWTAESEGLAAAKSYMESAGIRSGLGRGNIPADRVQSSLRQRFDLLRSARGILGGVLVVEQLGGDLMRAASEAMFSPRPGESYRDHNARLAAVNARVQKAFDNPDLLESIGVFKVGLEKWLDGLVRSGRADARLVVAFQRAVFVGKWDSFMDIVLQSPEKWSFVDALAQDRLRAHGDSLFKEAGLSEASIQKIRDFDYFRDIEDPERSLRRVYLFIGNPMVVDQQITPETIKEAKRGGHDSVYHPEGIGKSIRPRELGAAKAAGEWVVIGANRIKSADPVTFDDNGNIIPPSQRFQSTSPDIRYSRRTQAQVPELTSPDTAARSQENPMAFERDYGFLPAEYYKMAEAGRVADALQGYAVEKVAPYAKSQKKLLELREILMDDRRILDEFGIGATTGQAGLGYIYAEAALQAERLKNPILSEAFAFGRTAVGTSKGQGLVSEKFLVNDPRYQTLFHIQQANAVAREEQRNVVGGKFGEATPKLLEGELDKATETSGENVAGAIPAEISISEKVLELGAAVQNNPKLSERIKQFLAKIVTLGRLRQAREKAKVPRASIISNAESFEGMTPEELDAEIARLEAEIESEFTALEKDVADAVEKTKEKTPTDSAKRIINRIIKKAQRKERKKGELDPVEQLYKADLAAPMDQSDFVEKAASIGIDRDIAIELKNAIDLQLTAKVLEDALSAMGGDIEKKIKKANEQANKFQKRAEALIEDVVNRMADPPLAKEKRAKAADPLRKAYNEQLKNPVSREDFIAKLDGINVFEQTASALFDAAEMERAAREAIANARKLPPTPIETAKAIINRVQKKAATETAKPKPKLDRVRILYKSHLRERMDEQRFMKEAAAAGLDAKTAKELYDAAELEIAAIMLSKEVRGNSDNYDKLTKERIKHLDVDTSALVEYVNRLRRDGKLGEVRWADIFQLPPTRQQVIKDSLLDIVSSNPELQNLSEEEKSILADALERVWERERDRQFKMQVKRMELAGVKKEDADKLAEATPRLIRLINQGMTTTDAFYKAVGEQYGIKELSEAERKRVAELAEKVQDPELGRADKAKYARELVSILQKNHKLTRSEIISNVWVAHVLSGVRTQFDMALGVMNGLFSTVKKAAYTIYVNPNAKGAKAAGKGLQQFFAGLVDGIAEAARYVRTEEPGLIDSDIEFVSSYFEGGIGKGGISTARKLRESEKKIVRALGTWLSILERVTTAWDVINYRATLQGTLAMASQMNPRLYKEALMPTDADFAAMSERAKQMLGPTATRAQITARAMSYITDGIHLLGKNLDDAAMQQWKQMADDFRYDAKEATYMVDPTGIGGFFYNGIMGLAAKGEKLAKQRAEDAKKRAAGEEVSTTGNVAQRIFPPMLYFLATQSRNLLGFRFIRFTGNKVNELISFMPFIGMARIYLEQGMRRDGELTLKGANVRMNQFVSIAFGIPIFIKALLDLDKEDEERGYIVEGSWDILTPARQAQRMSTGAKPNTISFYDEDTGRWTSWNYINWPFAGILATIGTVSDYRRYTPEKWNEKTAAEKIMAGVYAGGSSFLDISSISQMTELFGRSTHSTDPSTKGIEKLTKAFTNYAGGFVPRLFKDIDSWFDDSGYRPEDTWGHLAAQIPVLRRSAGAPIRDIFYERVSVSRTPWSRVVQVSPDDEVYKTLGLLNSRGIWLTPPNPENRKIRTRDGLREMTEDEGARYMELTGQGYRNMIQKYGKKLLGMQPERAEVWVQKYAERVREMALKKALAKRGQSVTVDVE